MRDLCPWLRLLPSGKRIRHSLTLVMLTLNPFVKFKLLGRRKDARKEREGLKTQNANIEELDRGRWVSGMQKFGSHMGKEDMA
jgi:hypothetical protein